MRNAHIVRSNLSQSYCPKSCSSRVGKKRRLLLVNPVSLHQWPDEGTRIRDDAMSRSTKSVSVQPANMSGEESVLQPGSHRVGSELDQLFCLRAQQILQAAIELEGFLQAHAAKLDEQDRRLVVCSGRLPSREFTTGAGRQPRGRDKPPATEQRVAITFKILLPYLRTSQSINELIAWQCLKAVPTGDSGGALDVPVAQQQSG